MESHARGCMSERASDGLRECTSAKVPPSTMDDSET